VCSDSIQAELFAVHPDELDDRNGLPQTSVYSIAQTKDGYLCGHGAGLARFDGVRFVVFNRKNTPALPANYVHRLLGARDGSLWMHRRRADASARRGLDDVLNRDQDFPATISRRWGRQRRQRVGGP